MVKKKLSFFLTATDWLLHIPCDAFIRNQTLFTVFPFLAPFSFPHECFNPNLSALFQITSNFCGACSIGGSLHSHPFIQKQSKCPSVNVTACHHHNSHLAPHLPFKIMRMQIQWAKACIKLLVFGEWSWWPTVHVQISAHSKPQNNGASLPVPELDLYENLALCMNLSTCVCVRVWLWICHPEKSELSWQSNPHKTVNGSFYRLLSEYNL